MPALRCPRSVRTVSTAIGALLLAATPAAALFNNGTVIAPCDSPLYCFGEILKSIELAAPFSDSKTYVDMPTVRPLDEVVAAFGNLTKPLSNGTELTAFLSTYFAPAGGELESVPVDELVTNATFLGKLNDTVLHQFVHKVIGIWPDLTRRYGNSSTSSSTDGNCDGCQSSFVPINRTFVVAGGRFREPYYWDSYWIIEGLLRTGGSFLEISRNIIENFLDLVEQFGFVPNGARIYYLNRSQPPLLAQMVRVYMEHTNDSTILDRALPILIREHDFWTVNRSVSVTTSNKTYTLNHYSVANNQPRPESYLEDYVTANNRSYYAADGSVYADPAPLNETERQALYAQLASGAESGWDYTSRWLARPNDSATDHFFPLRSLNINNLLPVDLNSILYWNEATIAGFLQTTNQTAEAKRWAAMARTRSDAMHELMWNATHARYFDYNTTSGAQNVFVPRDDASTAADLRGAPDGYQVLFHIGQLYPFWTGAAPASLKNSPRAVKQAFARVADYLDANRGGIPATNLHTGQQWDAPNVWPPVQHVLMQGLLNTPATSGVDSTDDWADVQDLALRLAQRYVDSAFCTWYATGGSTSETPQLAGFTAADNGTMFEKYQFNSTNGAGGGGEYTVVEGFGWTNGVLIWAADTFGSKLTRPDCGNISAASITPGKRRRDLHADTEATRLGRRAQPPSAVLLDPYDAQFIKRFGR